MSILESEDTSSVLLLKLRVLIVERFEVVSKGVKVLLVSGLNFSEGETCGCLLMNKGSKSGLSFDEAVWDT